MKKAILLILLGAATARAGFGEEGHVDFRDSDLKAAVEKALGVSDPTADQMLKLTRLEARGLGIVDMRGLEYAVNLAHPDLRENEINDVSVLGNLTKLTELWLADNQVTDIHPLSSLTNLKRLFLFRNRISDISAVSGLKNLTGLSLYSNRASSISSAPSAAPTWTYRPGISIISLPRLSLPWAGIGRQRQKNAESTNTIADFTLQRFIIAGG